MESVFPASAIGSTAQASVEARLLPRAIALAIAVVAGLWLVGYFSLHANAVQGGLQLDPAGVPDSAIRPRVPWEFYLAIAGVGLALALTVATLIEPIRGLRRSGMLFVMLALEVSITAVGVATGVSVVGTEAPPFGMMAFLLGATSSFAHFLTGLTLAFLVGELRSRARYRKARGSSN